MPDHQRDFAWTDEEVEQFLNDVIGAIQDSEEDYFLGLVVLVKPESTEGGRRVSVLKWPKGAPLNLG